MKDSKVNAVDATATICNYSIRRSQKWILFIRHDTKRSWDMNAIIKLFYLKKNFMNDCICQDMNMKGQSLTFLSLSTLSLILYPFI
jgi:hypothetical protein